jgi:hypothetical protein
VISPANFLIIFGAKFETKNKNGVVCECMLLLFSSDYQYDYKCYSNERHY